MRKHIFFISLLSTFYLLLSTFCSYAQTTVCQGDTVILIVDNPAGAIQWQESSNQITWNNITGATNDSLQIQALTELFYRALIQDASCNLPINYYSDTLNFAIINFLPVSVSISVSPSTTICSNTSVTFTATPTNGGTSPIYEWKNNGATIIGETSSTYITTTLSNNDIITCSVASNYPCPTGNPAVSNSITMTVNQSPTVNAGSTMNAICQNGTSTALGGSFGGGATSAIWSAPSGTFSNNGLAPY